MVKKILVPIAFSEHSRAILHYAADLAAATGAELLVVNVINERDLQAVDKITSFGYKVDIEHYLETVKKERRELLDRLIGELTLGDERVTFSFCVGAPADELLKLVVTQGVDMVVMGVKSNNFSQLFTGSVAERLFQRSPVTIVSFRDEEIARHLRRRIEKQLAAKE